ncbi:MAG: tripartite tricarboxylate transporter substrate binding protein [Burkholderiales bacterium]|jgi:tripartite-type tricarboxylate transporter receptor subunit TctC
MQNRRRVVSLAAAVAALSVFRPAAANEARAWPTRPLRWVVPVAPGGALDLLARTLARELAPRLGQPVVVENVPGAGGNLAFGQVASAPADGHTVLHGWDSLSINPSLYPSVSFRLEQFAPVTLAVTSPQVLVVNPGRVPARSLDAFIALARDRAGALSVASPGSGSPGHLAATLLQTQAGITLTHVPYKGGGPALADLVAGHVDSAVVSLPAAVPHLDAGRLAAIGLSSARRSTGRPDLRTFRESGLPGYELDSWQGMLVPSGTPASAIARLHEEIATVLRDERVRAQLVAQGFEVVAGPPSELAALLERSTPQWTRLVRVSGAKVD